jgi:hypothetical protein
MAGAADLSKKHNVLISVFNFQTEKNLALIELSIFSMIENEILHRFLQIRIVLILCMCKINYLTPSALA